jgi:hypothetical protein
LPAGGRYANAEKAARQVEELVRQAKFADKRGETRRLAQIEMQLFEHWGVNFNDLSARAVGWNLEQIVQIEAMIASCERRRDQVLREMERRRREKAKLPVNAQDIPFREGAAV